MALTALVAHRLALLHDIPSQLATGSAVGFGDCVTERESLRTSIGGNWPLVIKLVEATDIGGYRLILTQIDSQARSR